MSLAEHDAVLDALGNATRRDILRHLQGGPLSVKQISTHFPISRPAISRHLSVLQDAHLVTHIQQGTSNIFSLDVQGFVDVRAYLESFWSEALYNFAVHIQAHPEESPDHE